MQEAPQVGWDPISINYQLPWASKLFVMYLLVVVTISLLKSEAHQFWFLTRSSMLRRLQSENESTLHGKLCSNRIQSIKRLVFVTLFDRPCLIPPLESHFGADCRGKGVRTRSLGRSYRGSADHLRIRHSSPRERYTACHVVRRNRVSSCGRQDESASFRNT